MANDNNKNANENSVFVAKNGEPISLVVCENDPSFTRVYALNSNQEKVGAIAYSTKNHNCFLLRIEILNPDYAHLGIGSALLSHLEEDAKLKLCGHVEGKFYPFGDLAMYSRPFYEKHGYRIDKDGYETMIFKTLQQNHTVQPIDFFEF